MAKEKKATGDAPKKRTTRSKASVIGGEQSTQQSSQPKSIVESMEVRNTASGTTEGSQEEVRRRAYELWEQRGRQHGRQEDDWYQAELEIRGKSA
jgi:hypothetical protein